MNNTISEFLKKLTICTMVLIFSFVLLAPTADALNYDPKNRKTVITPNGDDDPYSVDKVNDKPNYFYISFLYFWNFFIINSFDNPQIIDIEKEQYEPERNTEPTRATQVQTSYSGS